MPSVKILFLHNHTCNTYTHDIKNNISIHAMMNPFPLLTRAFSLRQSATVHIRSPLRPDTCPGCTFRSRPGIPVRASKWPYGPSVRTCGTSIRSGELVPSGASQHEKRCDSKPQRYLSHHCSNAASPTFSHGSWPCCNRIATACHFAKLRCNKSVPETVTKHRLQYLCSKLQQIKPMFNRRLLQLLSQLNQRISRHNCHITFQ